MKKALWLMLILLIVCVFALSACDNGTQPQIPDDTPPADTNGTTEETPNPNIPTHVHSFSEWVVIKNATCTAKGEKERSCSCGEKETADIAIVAHTEVVDQAVLATCTTDGKTEGKHCSVCGTTLISQNTIPASHTEGEWITDTDATCTENGSKHQVCAVCSNTIKTESIPATGHSCSETVTNRDCANPAKVSYACSQCSYTHEEEISSPEMSLEHTGTSSATMNGYGRFTLGYGVASNGGYGKILYKYELFANAESTTVVSVIDFTEETSVSVSYTGYEDTINDYVYKITAKDEAGNLSVYWFSLEDCSVIKSEDASAVAHSYENKICVCGRDATEDAVATYDLSKNQDGSIIAYLVNEGGGKKVYILGSGEMKNYSNITATGHTLTPFNTVNDITEVYFSNQITSIGSFLFYFCQGITTIDVPSSVTTIGERAFVGCQNIQTLILHEGLLSIEDQAFFGTSISKLQLPNSVQYIGDEAFSDTELEGEFFVSANVQFIGKAIIAHTGISSISVDANNIKYHSDGNCLIETATKTIIAGCQNSIIPTDGSVEHIAEMAFEGCRLTTIYIPNTIVSIGAFAFSGNYLNSIYIPNSVVQIENYAFYINENLTVRCEAASQPNDWESEWNLVNSYEGIYAPTVWEGADN